jgi:hypothetical protein
MHLAFWGHFRTSAASFYGLPRKPGTVTFAMGEARGAAEWRVVPDLTQQSSCGAGMGQLELTRFVQHSAALYV